jgi:serine/threonine protein kinase
LWFPSHLATVIHNITFFSEQHHLVRDNTSCPTFLLATGGPWFTILGAVFTDKVIVQRLTDLVWAGASATLNEPQCYRIAHILHSLGQNIARLKEYYLGIKIQKIEEPQHSRYFPSINTYCVDSTKEAVSFTYLRPLENNATCVTFLARTNEQKPKHIVVKFVERYGEAAHRLLEEQGTAPRLFYFGQVGVNQGDPTYGHLRMVVMEYLDGNTVREASKLGNIPTTFLEQVRKPLDYLHEQGFVFGNLRDVNVMITRNREVKLIDFDWAGKEQQVRYPLFLSDEKKWADGVTPGGIIEKGHDIVMLGRLV